MASHTYDCTPRTVVYVLLLLLISVAVLLPDVFILNTNPAIPLGTLLRRLAGFSALLGATTLVAISNEYFAVARVIAVVFLIGIVYMVWYERTIIISHVLQLSGL